MFTFLKICYICAFIFSFALGFFVFINGRNNAVNRSFFVSAILFGFWIFANFLMGIYTNIWIIRAVFSFGSLVPIGTVIFTRSLFKPLTFNVKIKFWILGIFLSSISFTSYVIYSVSNSGFGTFVGELGSLFWLWGVCLVVPICITIYSLMDFYLKCKGFKKIQALYIVFGLGLVGIFCIITDVIAPMFGNNDLMAFDVISVLIYLGFTSYAILKYNLMDIRVVITRATIFVFVYAIVLGLPLWLAYGSGVGKHAIWFMLVSATFGPFIYTHLRLVVERKFFHQQKLVLAQHEQLRRQKTMDVFSSSMAHEIINPVYAIMGISGVLKEKVQYDLKDTLSEKDKNYFNERLGQLVELSKRMDKMIKAIREFSSQAGTDFAPTYFNDVVDSCRLIVEPQLKEEGIACLIEVQPGLVFNGNKILMEEVMINLVVNSIYAIKQRDGGQGQVCLKAYRKDSFIYIELKDNGIGIKSSMLEDIFLDFVTTKPTTDGLGMGLSRARKIIAMHKGKIWAESEGEGKGAAIFIELPVLG